MFFVMLTFFEPIFYQTPVYFGSDLFTKTLMNKKVHINSNCKKLVFQSLTVEWPGLF